jgi:ABC-2 type transport system permease protein
MDKSSGRIDFRRVIPIARKEVLHIVRDIRSLVVVFLVPIVMLLLYSYALTFDIKNIDMGVVDRDHTRLSRNIIGKFSAAGLFKIYDSARDDMARNTKALKANRIKLILVVPEGFSKDLKSNRNAQIQALLDGSDSNTVNVALGYANIITAEFSRRVTLDAAKLRGVNPKNMPAVEPVPRIWYNPGLRSTNFIVPGLIAIIMMLIAALLTSLTIVREKERGTFEQLIASPIKPIELMVGKLIPYVVIGLCDVAIIIVVGVGGFRVPFRGDLLTLLLFSVLFIFCSLGLGLFMSSIVESQQVAVMATLLVTLLPSILLSGFVFPIQSMPWAIRLFSYVIPARYFLTALRSLFLKTGVGLSVLYVEALYLFFFGMLFLFISSRKFKKFLE